MVIHQSQQMANGTFVEMIDSFCAIRLCFDKTATFESPQMMRHQALFITKFLGNIGYSMGLDIKKANDIPPRLIAKGFEKKFMGLVEVDTLHDMNYNSYS